MSKLVGLSGTFTRIGNGAVQTIATHQVEVKKNSKIYPGDFVTAVNVGPDIVLTLITAGSDDVVGFLTGDQRKLDANSGAYVNNTGEDFTIKIGVGLPTKSAKFTCNAVKSETFVAGKKVGIHTETGKAGRVVAIPTTANANIINTDYRYVRTVATGTDYDVVELEVL